MNPCWEYNHYTVENAWFDSGPAPFGALWSNGNSRKYSQRFSVIAIV
jgi:hypothetical protein